MIDSVVRDEAKKFAGFWNAVLIDYPELKLDGTWPSIGIIDKILFPLRAKERFDKTDTEFIKGAAAYIGILAYHCWSTYKDVSCEIIKVGDGVEDYLLRASGGEFLKDQEFFSILLCRSIETALKSANKPIAFFADGSRYFTFEDNIISSIASGIVSGLCPQGQGKWSKLGQKEFEINLIKSADVMAQSSVEFYSSRYAGEEHGSDLQLYFPHLVLPPIKFNEPHLGSRATAALANYCISKKLSSAERKALTKNLSFSPDDSISTAGYLLSCADYNQKIPDWLLCLGNARGITNPLLRPGLALARKALDKKDFLEDLESGDSDSAIVKIQAEYYLGFLPLLYLIDFKKIPALPENFMYFIAWSSAKKSHDMLDNFNIFAKLPLELALQLAFLRINSGMIKEAEAALEIYFENNAPEDKELRFRYFEIKSLIAGNRSKLGIEYLEEAMLAGTNDPIRFAVVGNQLARHYLETEKHEQAVILCEKITEQCPWWLSAHLTKLIGMLALKRESEIDFIMAELSPYFSISNNLFSFLKARKISKIKRT